MGVDEGVGTGDDIRYLHSIFIRVHLHALRLVHEAVLKIIPERHHLLTLTEHDIHHILVMVFDTLGVVKDNIHKHVLHFVLPPIVKVDKEHAGIEVT